MESCTAHFIFTDQSVNDITKTHCDYKVFVRVSLCVCLLVHHLNAVCIVLKINCCVFSRSMVFKLSSTRESEKIVTKYSDLENTTCRTTNTTRHNDNDFFLLVSFYSRETLRNNWILKFRFKVFFIVIEIILHMKQIWNWILYATSQSYSMHAVPFLWLQLHFYLSESVVGMTWK